MPCARHAWPRSSGLCPSSIACIGCTYPQRGPKEQTVARLSAGTCWLAAGFAIVLEAFTSARDDLTSAMRPTRARCLPLLPRAVLPLLYLGTNVEHTTSVHLARLPATATVARLARARPRPSGSLECTLSSAGFSPCRARRLPSLLAHLWLLSLISTILPIPEPFLC